METQNSNQYQNHNNQNYQIINLENAPNSVAVLVLGILSIVGCWCYGILGLILGIIALILAASGQKQYLENPEKYSKSSYANLKAGKICAIIGTIISSLFIIFIILYFTAIFSLVGVGLFDALNQFNF